MADHSPIQRTDTQFLRALGILLIINSHLKAYYPIAHFGTGGAIGNSIFFALSAFGLYLSQQRRSKRFDEWLIGRIKRIYPSLWIVLIFLYAPVLLWRGKLSYSTMTTYLGYFFNPPFGFLQALLFYWLLTFRLLNNARKEILFVVLSLLSILYVGIYIFVIDLSKWSVEQSPFDLIHYFMVFIFGIYLAKDNKRIGYSGPLDFFCLIGIITAFYLHKFFMSQGMLLEYQFFQQLAMYPAIYYLLKISRSPFVQEQFMTSPFLSRIVDFTANNSLEIYLVHETITYPILDINMPFPVNIFVFITLTILISAMINSLANRITQRAFCS